MWQVISAQTGQAVKFPKQFIPMTKSCSHVSSISKMVKVSSGSTVHMGRRSPRELFSIENREWSWCQLCYQWPQSWHQRGITGLCVVKTLVRKVHRTKAKNLGICGVLWHQSKEVVPCLRVRLDWDVRRPRMMNVVEWLSRYWPHGGVVKVMTASSR